MHILEKFMRQLADLRTWSAAHPELNADWDEAIEADLQRDEQLAKARTAPTYLRACGVGRLEVEALQSPLRQTMARVGVREWMASGRLVLVLLGGAGCGKSIAAAEALALARPSPGRYVTSDALARASYYDREGHELLCRVPWLVVDDLGVEFGSATTSAGLEGLLCERISQQRRTILTTNLGAEAFAARYAPAGGRLASRLARHGTLHGCGETDLRRGAP